jgi:ketosteroid isomerase-like protein
MDNKSLIEYFYTCFTRGDGAGMASCYHDQVVFEDPAFGVLQGERARQMWLMLTTRNKDIDISFSNVLADYQKGSANWKAVYRFGRKGRKVVNQILASFEFKDGKIVRHKDMFDLWKWARQAMGWKGYLLGWSGFFQKKLQQQTNKLLDSYIHHKTLASKKPVE